jgi:phage terminase large subunit GpA-like protein
MLTESFPKARSNLRAGVNRLREKVLRPPPRMSIPDWADTYRHLSSSVGAVGGRWQTHRVEVARGPMMAVTEPGVEIVSVMSCTQIMKTEVLLNTLGYFAHLDPCPILLLEPKDEMAQAFSKERFGPMVSSSPALRDLFDTRTRNSEDTILNKRFPGGFLAMTSAGSPTNLAMRAIRVVLEDEVDKYETTKEGDPILLAEERTSTFRDSAVKIRACSPTWEDGSRIYKSWRESDQRRPYVCCPACGHEQTLGFFTHVHWEKHGEGEERTHEHKPETAAIHCEACGVEWSESDRLKMMTTKGAIRWFQTRPFVCGCKDEHGEPRMDRQDPMTDRLWEWDADNQIGYALCKHCGKRAVSNRHAGYTASKLYSPFISVVALVMKWLEAKDDPESKQTFYNTQLGMPFKAETIKDANFHELAQRAEIYDETDRFKLPAGVVALTAGVDVQPGSNTSLGRLECEVVGWGLGEESWSVETKVFDGDPAQPYVWKELDDYLLSAFPHEAGFNMGVMAACIDSGGHNTNEVYAFARPRMGRNIWAIKGASDRSGQWSPIWPGSEKEKQHKKFRVGFRPIILGVNAAKEAIRQRLLVAKPGPGYCHFPVGRPDGWYEQLTSEDLVKETKAGITIRSWKPKPGRRNEALDCRVYAYSALHGLYRTRKFSLVRAAERLRLHVAKVVPEATLPAREALAVPAVPPPEPPPSPRRIARSAFMSEH